MFDTVAAETVKRQRFERWVKQYGSSIRRTCFAYLVNKAEAEDATQDTFLKAWLAMNQFEGRNEAHEKTWLLRIAINVCNDYYRSRWFRHVNMEKALEDLPDRYLLTEAEDRTLFLDVLRLPPKLKQVILLRYYQEMTLQEVGEVLGIAASTVYRRLRKAEETLKITLTGGADDER